MITAAMKIETLQKYIMTAEELKAVNEERDFLEEIIYTCFDKSWSQDKQDYINQKQALDAKVERHIKAEQALARKMAKGHQMTAAREWQMEKMAQR